MKKQLGKNNKLLIIDPIFGTSKALMSQFETEYTVFSATSAEEGLNLIQSNDLQVVIFTASTSENNNDVFFTEIKKEYPDTIIIIISDYQDLDAVIAAINLGQVFRYLKKPLNAAELNTIVKEAFEKHELDIINRQLIANLQKANEELEEKLIQQTKELEQSNQFINESRDHFRLLYENAPLSYQSLNVQASLIDVNKRWLETLGYEKEEVIGKSFADFMTPESAELIKERFPEFISTGFIHDYEFNMVRKDGEIITVTYDGSIGNDEFGNFKQTHCIFQDITQKKIFEKKLKESEQKFRAIFELSMVGKSLTSLEGEIDLNTAFCNLLGYSKEEIKNKNWREITHKEDIEKNENILQSILKGEKESSRWEKRYIHKNGNIIWADIFTILRKDEKGNPLYFVTEIVDISQRKQAVKELKESEEKFRIVFESSLVGKSITMLDGTLNLNAAYCEIFGYTMQELNNKNWREITYKEDIELNEQITNSIMKGERDSSRWEKRFIHKDGHTVWADITTLLMRDEKGAPQYFITELADITQRKQAEKELEESEYRYRSLVNTGQALIWTAGLDKKCNYFNETWLAFTGRKLEQEIGDGWVEGVHPEDLQNCIDVYVNGFDKREFFSMEYRIRHHSGEYRWIQDDGSPRYNKDGVFLGYIGHCLDITDRKQISEALEKRIIALTKPLENDSDFDIEDLFNLSDLQKLQDDFSNATGVASIITYPDGTPITEPSNFRYLCDKIIRKTEIGCAKCYKSDSIIGELTLDGPTVQTCLSGGLWDAGSGISVGGKHIANWLIGQVRNEVQTEESALSYAHEIGADEEAYIKAFRQVPSMSRKRFEDIAQVVFTLSTQLSNSAYQNVQQARFISERKLAEYSLRKSEEKYRLLAENTSDVIWVLNLSQQKFTYISPAIYQLRGLTVEEALNENMNDALTPESFDLVKSLLNRDVPEFIKNPNNPIYSINEIRQPHKNGSIVWVEVSSRYRMNENSEIEFIGVSRNINERKQAEEKLKKVQQLHNEMEKIGKVGGWEFDIDTLKSNWTEETYRIHEVDYFNEKTIDQGKNYYTPASRILIDEAVNQAITLGKSFDLELEIITDKGNFRNVHAIGKADIDNRRVYGFFQDITERKQAEKALKESETKLSALFNGMTEMVVFHELVYDASKQIIDYRIIDCNETFTQITGIPKEVAIGELASKLYQTEKAPYLEEYSNVCITTEKIEFQTYFEPLDKHFVVSVISLGNNQFSTVTTDITEIQHSKEAIFRNNKELENYIYVASHDLRSPLVNIQGFSQRLQKQSIELLRIIKECKVDNIDKLEILKIVDEDMPKSLNYVLTNVIKMDKLINGLLQVSRTGKMTMNPLEIDMNKLITSIIGSYNYQFTEINAKVTINKLTSCYGDENQLNRLFSNLISNAIKYRCKERELNIEISAERNYNKVIYSIRDNGIGIHQKHLERMWDIFFRVDNKNEEGDGIGLSIVKRIVDLHKGKTWVESEEGIGTTFYIELQKDEFEI